MADEWIRQQYEDNKAGDAGIAVVATRTSKPDVAARANQISRRLGIPADVVERNIAEVEQRETSINRAAAAQRAPVYTQNWLADPRNSAAAGDDIEALSRMARVIPGYDTSARRLGVRGRALDNTSLGGLEKIGGRLIGEGLPRMAQWATAGWNSLEEFTETVLAPADFVTGALSQASGLDILDPTALREQTAERRSTGWREWKRKADAAAQAYAGDTPITEGLLSGLPSVTATLGSLLSGNPFAAASILGSLVGADAYQQGRSEGMGAPQAIRYGLTQGVTEGAFEIAPSTKLLDLAGKGFVKNIVDYLQTEVPSEMATTLVQSLSDWVSRNPERTYADWAASLPEELGQTALAAIGGGAVTVSAQSGVNYVGETIRRNRQWAREGRAVQEQAGARAQSQVGTMMLDEIMETAAATQLRETDPVAFREYIDKAAQNTPIENVYIPAEALRELLQEGYENDPFWGLYASQIEEASAIEGDVVIPLADVATHLAGTPEWNKLREEVRFSPGGASEAELAAMPEDTERPARLQAMAEQATAEAQPAAEVYADIKAQLTEAGYTPSAADKIASLYAAQRETWASRLGMTATEYHAQNPVEIKRADELQPGGRVIEQDGSEYTILPERRRTHRLGDPFFRFEKRGPDGEIVEQGSVYEDGVVTLYDGQHNDLPVSPEFGEAMRAQLEEVRTADDQAEDRGGRPEQRDRAPLADAPQVDGQPFGPIAALVAVAERYAEAQGFTLQRQAEYVEVSPEFGARIADAYEAMKHAPKSKKVKAAYADLIAQTRAQYDALVEAGFVFGFGSPEDAYFESGWNSLRDLRDNKRMLVFPTRAGFGSDMTFDPADNPLLAEMPGLTWLDHEGVPQPVYANDLFRAVHDAFGHGLEGAGFRARGEENAWQAHSRLFHGPALAALTTETRGQNSWLNFGPYGEANQTASIEDTVFADQKTGLLPEWAWTENVADAMGETDAQGRTLDQPAVARELVEGEVAGVAADGSSVIGWTQQRIQELLRQFAYSHDPERTKAYATRLSPDQFLGLTASEKGRRIIAERIEGDEYGGEIDFENMAANPQAPFLIVKVEGGFTNAFGDEVPVSLRTVGHEGRHRMTMLKKAGVTSVPVVVVMQDRGQPGEAATLSPQRSRSDQLSTGDTPTAFEGMQPISYANEANLEAEFGQGRVLFQTEPFFSALERAVEGVSANRAPAQQWLATLKKAPGVKEEELEWTGIEEWLAMQIGPVEKEAVLGVIRDGGIKVEEVVLGVPTDEDLVRQLVAERAPERIRAKQQELEDQFFESYEGGNYYISERDEDDDDDPLDEPKWVVLNSYTGPEVHGTFDTEEEAQEMADEANADDETSAFEEWKRGDWRNNDYARIEDDVTEEVEEEVRHEIGQPETKFQSWSSDTSSDTYRELLITLPLGKGGNPTRAPDTHWDESAVVAHTRFMDKTGPNGERILFVEEVQSDWHQKGRDRGYASTAKPAEVEAAKKKYAENDERFGKAARDILIEAKPRLIEAFDEWRADTQFDDDDRGNMYVRGKLDSIQRILEGDLANETRLGITVTVQEVLRLKERGPAFSMLLHPDLTDEYHAASLAMREAEQELANMTSMSGIPDAPFKKSWPDLVMKRIINYAANNGYDQVAWTTGEQQADRYNLSQAVGQIDVKILDPDEGTYRVALSNRRAESTLQDNRMTLGRNTNGLVMNEAQLKEAFGEAVAQRIVEQASAGYSERQERATRYYAAAERNDEARSALSEFNTSILVRAVEATTKRLTEGGAKADSLTREEARNRVAQMILAERIKTLPENERPALFQQHEKLVAEMNKASMALQAAGDLHAHDATLSGDDLRVGGEGMKAFYDRNLVNITNKIIKKYGTKVELVEVAANESGGVSGHQAMRHAGVPEDEISERWREAEQSERDAMIEAYRTRVETQPGFTITPELRDAAREGFALFQGSGGKGPRGRVSGGPISNQPGPAIIELFENADLSTVLHETGHVWLEELKKNAAAGGGIPADWQAVQDWFAANGVPVGKDGFIPTEAHELWARGFERYLMEGKAPSAGLRRAFDAFRGWLLTIYKHVANLKSPITPEIRRVFDRMLATEAEIEAAADRSQVQARFQNAEQAGMTEAEFAAYRQVADEARTEAFDALLYRTMATIRRERTAAWQAEKARVREEVTEKVNARPEFRALHFLRTGRFLDDPEREPVRMRLDKAWLEERGIEIESLPKAVPPIFKEGGDDPEIIAEMTGFKSADEMVAALQAVEEVNRDIKEQGDRRGVRAGMIEDEVDRVMAERHGDPLNDGSIEEEALAAIHNGREGEIIASEHRALARQRKEQPTPLSMAREWARQKIMQGRVVDVVSRAAIQRYARAQAKAAKAFEAALAEGNIEEAFRQSEIRLLNHALISEASKAAERIEVAVDRLAKVAKSKKRKSVSQQFYDRALALLEKFEFRQRSQREIDETKTEQEAFAVWAARQAEAGIDVLTPPRLEQNGEHYSRISVEELLGLDESVQQLLHLGRRQKKLLDKIDKREFDEVVQAAVATVEGTHQQRKNNRITPSKLDRMRANIASFDAALLKMEQVFDWLDDGNPNGVFNRHVFQPLANAQRRSRDMIGDYLGKVRELMQGVPKEQIKRWDDKVETPLLNRETGQPFDLTRQDLISMALNVGNEGNFDKLARGYGWNRETIMEVLSNELSAEEWQFVQGVWDLVDTLWPEIEGLEKRVNGVAPEKIEAREFTLPDGTVMRGGYYPVVYDPLKSQRTEQLEGKATEALFSSGYQRATTRQGHAKERTDVARPIQLSLSVLNRHLTSVIHDITHREAIMQADRFLSDRRIVKAVDESVGREARKQFRPWLSHIANEWAFDARGLDGIEALAKRLRTSSTIIGMGFRLTTILAQAAGYAGVAERIGTRWLASGVKTVSRDPVGSFEFVMERSNEVRHRMDTLERDIDANVKEMAGKTGLLANARRFAFHGIGYMDRVVVIPAWIGSYTKGMSEGMSEEEAAHYADKVVRESQGAGGAKDLAALQRGSEYMRLATMFYSYASAFYNRQRNLARDTRRAVADKDFGAFPGLLARAFWLLIVSPILGQLPGAVLSGGGPDEDKDETWPGWAAASVAANMFYGIPIARDIASSLATGFDYQFTPASRALETLVKAGWDVKSLVDMNDETEPSDKAVKTAVEAVGYTLRLPIGQIANAMQFLVDWANGETDPDGVGDWLKGLQRGKLDE